MTTSDRPSIGGEPWTHTVLHSFANSGTALLKGYGPTGTLIRDQNGALYGTTGSGGVGRGGTVYKLKPPIGGGSWTHTVLHSFDNSGPDLFKGYYPTDGVIRLTTAGGGFSVLHQFSNAGPRPC